MNKNILIIASFGILVTFLIGFSFSLAAAGIVLVVFLTLLLAMTISDDAAQHMHPDIFASLLSDAETIIVENLGTAVAKSVQVRIIPDDIRYEIGDLTPDTTHRYQLPAMVREAKAAVSWEKNDGTRVEKVFRLSGYVEEADPLRPVFPLFSWKEK